MATKYGPNVNENYWKQIEAARNELRAIIIAQNCASNMLLLAFGDACTYDAKKKTGGANGTIRFKENNKIIKVAVDLCEQVKAKHPKITYADLYQLAGVVAIEATEGPAIYYSPGRRDASQEEDTGDLPNLWGDFEDAQHVRKVFQRMGFSDGDIVALLGSYYTLGRALHDKSDIDGSFAKEPLKFDNSYYVELMKVGTQGPVEFPTAKFLVDDSKFSKFAKIYAHDKKRYFEDYAKAHKKMSQLVVHRPVTFDVDRPFTFDDDKSHKDDKDERPSLGEALDGTCGSAVLLLSCLSICSG